MSALKRLRRMFGRNTATATRAAVSSSTVDGNEMRALLDLAEAALSWRETRTRSRGDREAEQAESDMLAALTKLEDIP